MAIFSNQATLTYNGSSTNPGLATLVVTGTI